jgi:putative hydrolase of the HAD superfamily
MSKFKAVGFDYGGVLTKRVLFSLGDQVSKELGISLERYKEIYFLHNRMINVEGDSWEDFWKTLLDEVGKPEKLSAVLEISDLHARQLRELNPYMLGLVRDIKSNGYKTGMLSNATVQSGKSMRLAGVDKYFDVFLVSAEIGFMKPQPEAFAKFINELGVKPEELIFIDDAEKSLSAADECGYTPLLFRSYQQVRGKLTELGVL